MTFAEPGVSPVAVFSSVGVEQGSEAQARGSSGERLWSVLGVADAAVPGSSAKDFVWQQHFGGRIASLVADEAEGRQVETDPRERDSAEVARRKGVHARTREPTRDLNLLLAASEGVATMSAARRASGKPFTRASGKSRRVLHQVQLHPLQSPLPPPLFEGARFPAAPV